MKFNSREAALRRLVCLCAALGWMGQVDALDLSMERCNIHMGVACMVLPLSTSVSMDAPIDFQRYRFVASGQAYLFVYLQNSPAVIDGKESFEKKGRDFTVSGFRSMSDGKPRIDIVFTPVKQGTPALHIYTESGNDQQDLVEAALAGLRICHQSSMENYSCPLTSDLGPDLVKWMRR